MQSYGVVPHIDEFASAKEQMTLGLILHRNNSRSSRGVGAGSGGGSSSRRECVATKAGAFSLCLVDEQLVWSVVTVAGVCNCTSKATTNAAFPANKAIRVKATYNSTVGSGLKLFVDGTIVGFSKCYGGGHALSTMSTADIVFGAESRSASPSGAVLTPASSAPHVPGGNANASPQQQPQPQPQPQKHVVRDVLKGALEEIYFKNVSAENRAAYLYADDNRRMGTFIIDLTRPPGRALFAKTINAVLNQFDPAAIQYDGFEKLQLIAGQDFGTPSVRLLCDPLQHH